MERLGTLKEFNMDYVTFDSRTFVLPLPYDLATFYSADAHEAGAPYEAAMDGVVFRLGTLFASLKETPSVRFRAGRSTPDEGAAMREMLAGRLAGKLAERITALQGRVADMPAGETCDLLILDRGVDPMAPVVHDWSYECLCHDLLRMKGPLFRYRYTANNNKVEEKDVSLDESDVLFRDLRSLHLADVLIQVSERMAKFSASNKKAGAADMSVSSMKKMVESLPQYREQLQKLSVHSTVSGELNDAIKLRRLNDVGTLEQDLIFGESTSKDVLRLLESLRPAGSGSRMDAIAAEALSADRLRLLMCYFGTHAEKLDGAAGVTKWRTAAGLAPDDMAAVLNLELFGCAVLKKPPGAPKAKESRRKPPPNEEGWDLPKFVPRVAELAAELVRGELSQEAFPYVNPPMDGGAATRAAGGVVPGRSARSAAASVRSTRTAAGAVAGTGTWASSRRGADGLAMGDLRLGGGSRSRRLVIFVLGPISYNEIRAAHELSAATGREVLIGGTSVCTPEEFVGKLKLLRGCVELDE
jgi:syntaxin-binding protein 1